MDDTITGIRVDSLSTNRRRVAARFTYGHYTYHIWFDPETTRHEGVLFRDPVATSSHRRSYTTRVDPSSKDMRPVVDRVWRYISEEGLVSKVMGESK